MADEITFPEGAEDYYKVDKALAFLNTPVPEGCVRWRCKLCGRPAGDFKAEFKDVGAFCCGGCGQTCVRPIEEY
jgi:hypothetical protein